MTIGVHSFLRFAGKQQNPWNLLPSKYLCCTVLSIEIILLIIHNTDKKTLLQHRYEIILFPNYFITVVYYYCTHPILFLYFFLSLLLSFSKILSLLFFCFFFYGIYNFISDSTFYFYLQCILWYSLDSTIVGSKITLIMCSFLIKKPIRSSLVTCTAA